METVLNRNVLHVHSSAMVLRAQRGLGAGLVGLAVAAASVGALAPPVPLFRALGPSATSPKRFTSLVFGSTLGLKCDRRPVSAVHGHANEEMGREGEGSCDDAEARRVANVQALEHHYAGRDRDREVTDLEAQWVLAHSILFDFQDGLLGGKPNPACAYART